MNELRSLLKAGDPMAAEPALPPPDIARMRRAVLSGPRQIPARRAGFSLAVAGLLLGVTAGSAWVVRLSVPEPAAAPAPQSARLQLLFSAPGGTRVIWTFNPDLEVR